MRRFIALLVIVLGLATSTIPSNAHGDVPIIGDSIPINTNGVDDPIIEDINPFDTNGVDDPIIGDSNNSFQVAFNDSQTQLQKSANTSALAVAIMDFSATKNAVIITASVIGVGEVSISGSVTINGTSKTFSFKVISIGIGFGSKSVTFNMLKCSENISVSGKANGKKYSLSGSRNIPASLKDKWGAGSFPAKAASINYHFDKHHSELSIADIVSYVESADSFRKNLSGATGSTLVNGETPDVYRWRKSGKYIDVKDGSTKSKATTGLIISYGGK
jgi:hypothetical protein